MANPEDYVGISDKFIIDRLYSDNKIKIVLSRRAWLEKEIELKRNAFFQNTEIGDVVEGTVKSFTSSEAIRDGMTTIRFLVTACLRVLSYVRNGLSRIIWILTAGSGLPTIHCTEFMAALGKWIGYLFVNPGRPVVAQRRSRYMGKLTIED